MSRILERWDAAQPHATLERIETSLEQLHTLVSEQSDSNGPGSNGCVEPEDSRDCTESNPVSEAEIAQLDPLANWEQLKAQLLSDQPAPEASKHGDPRDPVVAVPSEPPQPSLDVVDAPQAIDVDNSDNQALDSAISHRDRYIAFLIRKLRITELHASQFPDWAKLSNAPDDLRRGIDDLRKTLDEHLRLAEVELALERARLSREATRLHALKLQLNQRINDQAKAENASKMDSGGNLSTSARRWLRFLGSRSEGTSSRTGSP